MIDTLQDYPVAGIATDGAHSTKQGRTRYRGVDLATGDILFSQQAGNRTANVGEFLGVVTAARYILEHNYVPAVIYTDSTTAISWYRAGRAATRRRSPDVLRAEVFLRLMAVPLATVEIRHWDTRRWGEIPADYGEK
ncbi:ribonuclease H [Alistipes sp.]|uniref:ribonuclease H n=1 Tax=Alistipes sp. TaxID=1872444 RepID=UPI003AF94506